MLNTPRYPDVHVQLTGQDGNAMYVIGAVTAALRRANPRPTKVDVEEFVAEAMSGDYDNVLRTAMKWVSVS